MRIQNNCPTMKIRILHVVQAAGGVDKYIKMLLKYMNHERFENILVCSYDFKEEDYYGIADVLEYVDMQRNISKADISAMRAIRKIIKKYEPDIVYAHSSKAGAVARVADIGIKKNGKKIRCIYNPHGWAFNMRCSKIKQMLYTIIERMLSRFCSKIICISEAEKQSALEHRICKEDKLQVILNGVDVEEYMEWKEKGCSATTRSSLSIPEDAFIIGMVGRITTQKAPDVFIKAAKLIKEQIYNAYFIIVGDGEQREIIEQYALENDLQDSLLITGWIENVKEYIDIFDIAMLLSRWEGFGLVLTEYMLAGKPIIASKVDAIPSIINDGENGILVAVDNTSDVFNAVKQLYDNEKLRDKLASAGVVTVHDKYDVKRVAKEHELLIKKYLNIES